MKASLSIRGLKLNQFAVAFVSGAILLSARGSTAFGQSSPPAPATTTTTAATAETTPPTTPVAPETAPISADQLDSLVAPIAMYPDPVLAQTLAAATYPLEVIQLHQWLERNKQLKDKALS